MKVSELLKRYESRSAQKVLIPEIRKISVGNVNSRPTSPSLSPRGSPRIKSQIQDIIDPFAVPGYVLFDFISESKDELTVHVGDVVTIMIQEKDWIWCSLNSNEGNVPSCYLTLNKLEFEESMKRESVGVFSKNVSFTAKNEGSLIKTSIIIQPKIVTTHIDDEKPEEVDTLVRFKSIITPATRKRANRIASPNNDGSRSPEPFVEKLISSVSPDVVDVPVIETIQIEVITPVVVEKSQSPRGEPIIDMLPVVKSRKISRTEDFNNDQSEIERLTHDLHDLCCLKLKYLKMEAHFLDKLSQEEIIERDKHAEKDYAYSKSREGFLLSLKKKFLSDSRNNSMQLSAIRPSSKGNQFPSTWGEIDGQVLMDSSDPEVSFLKNSMVSMDSLVVYRVENRSNWENFVINQKAITAKKLSTKITKLKLQTTEFKLEQVYLFFMCTEAVKDRIISEGFGNFGKICGPLGCGYYFYNSIEGLHLLGEKLTALDSNVKLSILACRVNLGIPEVWVPDQDVRYIGFDLVDYDSKIDYNLMKTDSTLFKSCPSLIPGSLHCFDSLLKQTDPQNLEIVIFNSSQIYPEYIINMTR